MSTSPLKALATGLALAALVMLAAPVALATDEPTVQQIDAATTAADHEAIAAQYQKLADEARQKAALHQRRADHYAKRPPFKGRGRVDRSTETSSKHCAALAKTYGEAADEYEMLAKEHREIAADAP